MSALTDVTKTGLRIATFALLRKFFLPLLLIMALFLGALILLGSITGGVTGGGTTTNVSACRPTTGGSGEDSNLRGSAELRAHQIENAKLIDEGVAELGYSGKTSRLIIIAAFGESTLENIDYGDDIHGVRNPDGSLTSSIGVLQQQEWWGSREERMNPKIAAQLFILGAKRQGGGLGDVAGWENLPESHAINRVQKNSNPDHYTASISSADAIIAEAGIDVEREGKTSSDNAQDAPESTAATADSCKGNPGGNADANNTYPWGEYGDGGVVTAPNSWAPDPMGFFYGECTSYAMWKVNEYLGGDMNNLKYTNGSGSRLGNGYQWREGWQARGWKVSTTPAANSVAWWGANGASGIGEYGHVAWIDSVAEDGSFIISEYNNNYLAPPGHKYSKRDPISMDDPSAPNAFLIPPDPSDNEKG